MSEWELTEEEIDNLRLKAQFYFVKERIINHERLIAREAQKKLMRYIVNWAEKEEYVYWGIILHRICKELSIEEPKNE